MISNVACQIVASKMLDWCKKSGVSSSDFYFQFRGIDNAVMSSVSSKRFCFMFLSSRLHGWSSFVDSLLRTLSSSGLYKPLEEAMIFSLNNGGSFRLFHRLFLAFEAALGVRYIIILTANHIGSFQKSELSSSISSFSRGVSVISFLVDESLISGWKVYFGYSKVDNSLLGKINCLMKVVSSSIDSTSAEF